MAERQTVDELHRAYSMLGVPPIASPEEIRQRYLRLSKQWHPDKWMSDPLAQWRATEKMKRLNETDSLIALFGVGLIRESDARLDDIRALSRHTPSGAAFGWQSWIVSFGDAAERVLGLRALADLVVACSDLAVLRRRGWPPPCLRLRAYSRSCAERSVCGLGCAQAVCVKQAYRWTSFCWRQARRGSLGLLIRDRRTI